VGDVAGGGAGAANISSSSGSGSAQKLSFLARQVLEKVLLLAPAKLTSLDCLPQLCKVLLGPSAAHALLFEHSQCSSACHAAAAGSSGSSVLGQQERRAAAPVGVAGGLQSVLIMARQMASAVSPR
jgi:hypothetical protein